MPTASAPPGSMTWELLPAEAKDLIKLNVFAVQFHYVPALGFTGTVDRVELLDQVEKLFKHIRTGISAF